MARVGDAGAGLALSATGVVAEYDLQRALSWRVFKGVIRLHGVIQRETVCHMTQPQCGPLWRFALSCSAHDGGLITGDPWHTRMRIVEGR